MNGLRSPPDRFQREAAPRLRHVYVAGLRFDKEPCHAVFTGRGLRWATLPWPIHDSADAHAGNACAIGHAFGLLAMRKIGAAGPSGVRQRANGW